MEQLSVNHLLGIKYLKKRGYSVDFQKLLTILKKL